MRLIDADTYAAEMKKRQDACWHLLEDAKENGGVSFAGIDRLNAIYATFSEAKLTLDEMPTIGGWISVQDRMPEPGTQCLVFTPFEARKRPIETATYTEFGWMTAAYFPGITHWMPLPGLPKEADHAEA